MNDIPMPTLTPQLEILMCPVENGWMVRVKKIAQPTDDDPLAQKDISVKRMVFCADHEDVMRLIHDTVELLTGGEEG